MLLDRFQLAEAAAAGDPAANISPIKINNDPDITFRSPFEYIYARYDRRPDLQVSDNTWYIKYSRLGPKDHRHRCTGIRVQASLQGG